MARMPASSLTQALAQAQMQDAQESMQEAIDLYIKYARVSEPTVEGRIARLEKMLQDVASGSWGFSGEFNVWRDAQE